MAERICSHAINATRMMPYEKCLASSAKRVAKTQQVDQVMKLGFLNLAKKISLTWMSMSTKDESH